MVKISFERKPKEDKPKKEFTKTAYKFNVAFVVVITLMSFALMVYSSFVEHIDISAIAYIVPPAWVELGMFSGLYVWKAKHENLSKAIYGDYTKENAKNKLQELENEVINEVGVGTGL